jgi:tRNA pseudouridine55 synthase
VLDGVLEIERSGRLEIMGIFVVDKPLGLTSFDVVARARRALGTRRVGHTGTLDPLATGVLIIATDESTKLVQFLEKDSKEYLAFVSLGASTPTLDAEGPVLETSAVPDGVLERERVNEVLESFVGPQMQMPPAYSAIHVNGQRAYDLARSGQDVKLEPRAVTIHALRCELIFPTVRDFQKLEYRPTTRQDFSRGTGWSASPNGYAFKFPEPLGEFPTLMLNVSVSSGTYIRSLARDIGLKLGVPAHLAGLVRTRVGKFNLENAATLEKLRPELAIPDLDALDLPVLELSAKEAKDVRDGKRHASSHTGLVTLTHDGNLVAIAEGDGVQLKVRRAWQ